MKHIGDSSQNDANIEISPQEISADSGATVTISYSGNAWARPGAPGNLIGVVLGIEDTPFPCVYFGIPGVYPGAAFSGSLPFTAPSERGEYRLFGIVAAQYTPADAERWYREHPELRFQMGTLTVGAPVWPWWWPIAAVGGGVAFIAVVGVVAYQESEKRRRLLLLARR